MQTEETATVEEALFEPSEELAKDSKDGEATGSNWSSTMSEGSKKSIGKFIDLSSNYIGDLLDLTIMKEDFTAKIFLFSDLQMFDDDIIETIFYQITSSGENLQII